VVPLGEKMGSNVVKIVHREVKTKLILKKKRETGRLQQLAEQDGDTSKGSATEREGKLASGRVI
jgi:hypothetical protein